MTEKKTTTDKKEGEINLSDGEGKYNERMTGLEIGKEQNTLN